MENFDWTSFTKKTIVKASMQQLYDAWTIPSEIEKWFLKETQYFESNGEAADRFKNVEAGDRFEWQWYFYDGVEKNKVVSVNGKDKLQFKFAIDCLVEVTLKQIDDANVLVQITQSDIPTDDQSKKDVRLGCESGWAFYLVNLKSVYEGGLDLRNKEIDINTIDQ